MLIFKGRNRVTQVYKGSAHTGIDIVGDDDKNVRAVSDGVVYRVQKWDGVTKTGMQSYGNLVIVRDSSSRFLYYAHLASFSVTAGSTVKAGQIIGVMGNTGNSFGAHTHFEVRASNMVDRLNPAEYLGIDNLLGTYTDPKRWVFSDNNWYYLKDGVKQVLQWVFYENHWYWVGMDGKMATGWITLSGKRYWLNPAKTAKLPMGALLITDSSGAIK